MGVYYGMNGLWVPVGGQGGAAPVDPNLLAENIKSGVTISGVTGTFTSDGTAKASDILTGKISYVNGIKVTGTMKDLSGGWSVQNLMPTYDTSLSSIKLQHSNSVQGYFPANTSISYYSSISNFGNATASDVASGKTFTSSAGLKVTGTGSMSVDQSKIKVLKSSKSYPFDVMDSTNKILYLQFDGAIPDKSKILSVSLYMYDTAYSSSKTNLIITGLSAYKAPIVPDFLNAHIVNNIVMYPQEYSLPVNYTPATCPSGWTLSNTIAISLSGLGSNVSGYTASAFGSGACSYFLYYYDD